MAKKRRLPIQQLRETAKEAEIILRNKGIHTKESTIDAIVKEGKTILPGMPEYLPHRWSLMAARKILADLVILWLEETKGKMERREDHKEFFQFVVREMEKIEKKRKRQTAQMPAIIKAVKGSILLSKVFKPMNEMETTHTMGQFLVDSFAVAVILKQHQTVSDFVIWFDEWTKELDLYWGAKETLDG